MTESISRFANFSTQQEPGGQWMHPLAAWFLLSRKIVLADQLFHLRQVVIEQPERQADWLWRVHIDASFLQQVNAVFRGAGTQEVQVAIHRGLSLAQNLLNQGRGC